MHGQFTISWTHCSGNVLFTTTAVFLLKRPCSAALHMYLIMNTKKKNLLYLITYFLQQFGVTYEEINLKLRRPKIFVSCMVISVVLRSSD